MAVTRAKATSLLNAAEMGLYDDSRANALRGHSEAKLARLVTRARTARDRARDLEKRQRLASRSATGSKSGRSGQANARTGEKVELLADILKRLEAQHRDAAKAEKAAARDKAKAAKSAATAKAKTAAAKRATGKKVTGKTTNSGKVATGAKTASASASAKKPAKKAAAKQASSKAASAAAGKAPAKGASKTAAARKDAVNTSAVDKRTAKKGAAKKAGISPKRALANTRKLLAEQEAKAAQPKSWDGLGNEGTAQAVPGFQSPQARSRVLELHAGETRQAPIHGSISTRDRKNQGKRDHRSK